MKRETTREQNRYEGYDERGECATASPGARGTDRGPAARAAAGGVVSRAVVCPAAGPVDAVAAGVVVNGLVKEGRLFGGRVLARVDVSVTSGPSTWNGHTA